MLEGSRNNHIEMHKIGAMPMKMYNLSFAEFAKNTRRFFIGISLGNKHVSPERARQFVEFCVLHSRDRAAILLADDIDVVNWQVFRGYSQNEAEAKVSRRAENFEAMFRKATKRVARDMGLDNECPVKIVRWRDIRSFQYGRVHRQIVDLFENSDKFRSHVLKFVKCYADHRGVHVDEDAKEKLAGYILAELPTLLEGIWIDQEWFDTILYPTYARSGMSLFARAVASGAYGEITHLRGGREFGMMEVLLKEDELSHAA